MPYGYVDNGKAVEIFAGQPFTTPRIVVAADDAEFHDAAPGSVILHLTKHPANALFLYTPEQRARFQIQQFNELGDPPSGKVLSKRTLVVTNDVISAQGTYINAPAPAVPEEVSSMQLKRALLAAGLLDEIDQAIADSGDRDLQLYWALTSDFHRNHPRVLDMVNSLGMNAAEADAIWTAAKALT